ncbi:MAG: TIGR00282 family metallophosphoesterase [Candidatus Aminicenantes bacterium]|nr:MAG: TIGR00282 family metallophosphoesterase [Candidatus Aminicenantes bacterium]
MQNKNLFRILFVGDISGRYGRRFLGKSLPTIKIKFHPNLVIANGENSAGGLGITHKTAREIFEAGVDVITSGNHVWDKKEALDLLEKEKRVIRPINYPEGVPGKGYYIFTANHNTEVMIVNLQGRVFMDPVVDNPFLCIDKFLNQVRQDIIIVDFHAEATAEKQAMGFYLDGRVSAVLGTHTHVQTSDLRILPGGTAYQTDVGMTGSLDSIIGMKRDPVIRRFLTGINQKFEVARENIILDMVICDINKQSGKAVNARSMRIFESTYDEQLMF